MYYLKDNGKIMLNESGLLDPIYFIEDLDHFSFRCHV